MASLTPFLCVFILAISASHIAGFGREERGYFDWDSLTNKVSQMAGNVEQSISPEAVMSFCKQHGFTHWVGQGPEPVESNGLISKGMSAWGSFAGGVWDLAQGVTGGVAGLGGSAIDGTCNGAGWSQFEPVILYDQPAEPWKEPVADEEPF